MLWGDLRAGGCALPSLQFNTWGLCVPRIQELRGTEVSVPRRELPVGGLLFPCRVSEGLGTSILPVRH